MSYINTDSIEQMDSIKQYRRVFNTPDGRQVLADMLGDLHYHDTIPNQGDAVLHNYAKTLLYKLGILQDHNEVAIVEAFFDLPYIPPQGD